MTFMNLTIIWMAIMIVILVISLNSERKLRKTYEAMVDKAIDDLSAVGQVTEFGLTRGMEVNINGVTNEIHKVLDNLEGKNNGSV